VLSPPVWRSRSWRSSLVVLVDGEGAGMTLVGRGRVDVASFAVGGFNLTCQPVAVRPLMHRSRRRARGLAH
jgi:hypothetical protein